MASLWRNNMEERPYADVWEDYINLCHMYPNLLVHEIGSCMIQFSVKMLMDCMPTHKEAHEMIKKAVESGMTWHVEEQKEKEERK